MIPIFQYGMWVQWLSWSAFRLMDHVLRTQASTPAFRASIAQSLPVRKVFPDFRFHYGVKPYLSAVKTAGAKGQGAGKKREGSERTI